MEREFKTLENIGKRELLAVFNTSFSDYFIPLQLTEAQFESKLFVDQTNLNLSVGVFEDNKLIAFILHGLKKANGKKLLYNGGTGVIPSKKGLGLSHLMYQFIIPILAKKEIDSIVLEVISENAAAISVYQKSEFKIQRKLQCFSGELNLSLSEPIVEIRNLATYDWELMKSFWDFQPSWQNAESAVEISKKELIAFGAYQGEQLIGYLIYHPKKSRIVQLAVDKAHRKKKVGASLISELANQFSTSVSTINMDQRAENTINFLKQIGLKPTLMQLEMRLQLESI